MSAQRNSPLGNAALLAQGTRAPGYNSDDCNEACTSEMCLKLPVIMKYSKYCAYAIQEFRTGEENRLYQGGMRLTFSVLRLTFQTPKIYPVLKITY